jgi:putative hydrolase of the HAD superfamily
MIQNIVFDMGGVLLRFEPELFVSRYTDSEEDRTLLVREVYRSCEWVQLDRGSLTGEEVWQAVCARLPERLHGIARKLIFEWDQPAPLPVEGMEELVRELRGNGYGIYLLSNAGVRHHEYWQHLPVSKLFDKTVISADLLLLKPEKEIYEELYRQCGLDPAECLFIDDLPTNIEGARCTGMDGCVFYNDIPYLRRQLAAKGVRVSL